MAVRRYGDPQCICRVCSTIAPTVPKVIVNSPCVQVTAGCVDGCTQQHEEERLAA